MSRRRRVTLSFTDWPATDRVAWHAAIAEGDLFDGRGPAAHWRPASRSHAMNGYARWLAWLVQLESRGLHEAPADRVTEARLRYYVAELQAILSASSAWNALKGMYDALRVMVPDHDWTWLKQLKADLERRVPSRDCRDRIIDVTRIYNLGLDLMEAADLEHGGHRAWLEYRDGLIIALLAVRPLRRRNLSGMRVDRHLVRIDSRFVIVFDESETKTGEPIEFVLPKALYPQMAVYLEQVRPCFPRANEHDGVWASSKGGPMSGEAIYEQARKRTRAAFGVAVNLHQFRHNLATFIAYEFPGHVGVAAGMLQHRDYRTTERHYVRARSVMSGRTYQDVVARRRHALKDERRCANQDSKG